MAHRTGIAISFSLAAALAIACGSSDTSNFGDGSSGGSSGSSGGGGGFGEGDDDGNGGGGDDLADGGACAAQEVAATRKPVKLLLALDQSGSMGGGQNNNRWVPVTTALKAFLAQPDTVGIEASMRLFPVNANESTRCNAASYATPDVPMTALPDNTAFANRLVANPNFSGTPTRAVIRATVADAKVVQAANPQAKVAIVLISDGDPAGCSGDDRNINNIIGEVSPTKDTIPTYVIGVGNINNLNLIAQGGGPRGAFVVATNDPAATQTQFLEAINEIRGEAIACEIDIPPPPAGEKLDADKVNVNYTPTGKPTEQLKYDENCAAGGWRYDNKADPKQVVLCPATCTVAKADPTAKVALAFGCARRSSGPN
ncbi:MAG: VWA domain-containing protein [Labilithrix sp.]|nr:VWA domain-containing protein [Labilithrix sp.]